MSEKLEKLTCRDDFNREFFHTLGCEQMAPNRVFRTTRLVSRNHPCVPGMWQREQRVCTGLSTRQRGVIYIRQEFDATVLNVVIICGGGMSSRARWKWQGAEFVDVIEENVS